jgi:hypothetical protein
MSMRTTQLGRQRRHSSHDRRSRPAKPALRRAALSQFCQSFDETLCSGMALADRPEAVSRVLGLAFFLGNLPQVEKQAGGFARAISSIRSRRSAPLSHGARWRRNIKSHLANHFVIGQWRRHGSRHRRSRPARPPFLRFGAPGRPSLVGTAIDFRLFEDPRDDAS